MNVVLFGVTNVFNEGKCICVSIKVTFILARLNLPWEEAYVIVIISMCVIIAML